jgi:uroporphyrinogen-III synthase
MKFSPMSTASVSKLLAKGSLEALSVLVTRPEYKQANLCHKLLELKAIPLQLPTIGIIPVTAGTVDFGRLKQTILDLDLFDIIICVSGNAARLAGELIDQYWPQLPIRLKWYAIGHSTANILSEYDIEARVASDANDSEALLSLLIAEQIDAKKVLIFKGRAGRTLLTEKLTLRGANVSEAVLYNRVIPVYTDHNIEKSLYNTGLSAILVTSGEALQNLTTIAQGSRQQFDLASLHATDLIVPSTRVAQIAAAQGYHQITVAAAADDESMLAALLSVKGLEADDEKT